jgi:hypothetical protein
MRTFQKHKQNHWVLIVLSQNHWIFRKISDFAKFDFSLDIFQLFRHPIWFSHRACPSSKTTLECSHSPAEGGDGLVSSRTQPLDIGLPVPITPSATSRYLLYSAEFRTNHVRKLSRSQTTIWTFRELAAAPVMRITPDLHQRSRKKSLRTFLKKKLVPD